MEGYSKRWIPILVTAQLLFGGFLSLFGWIFFGFGMCFVWVFVGNADLSFLTFHGQKDFVEGTILVVNDTNASVDDQPVIEHIYSFRAHDGIEYEGISYATGREYPEGTPVNIEYLVRNPDRSRIEGMRTAQFGPLTLFVLIFPLVGLPFMVIGMFSGIKRYKVLRRGLVTTGKLVSKYATNTRINDLPVYKLTFQFFDGRGKKYRAIARSHLPGKLQDEAEEYLVYDPDDPSESVLVDDLPGGAGIDSQGEIHFTKPFRGIFSLIVPVLVIGGHGLYLVSLIN